MGSKSLYQGARGVVYDVTSAQNISVYVEAFDEIVSMPLDHVCIVHISI